MSLDSLLFQAELFKIHPGDAQAEWDVWCASVSQSWDLAIFHQAVRCVQKTISIEEFMTTASRWQQACMIFGERRLRAPRYATSDKGISAFANAWQPRIRVPGREAWLHPHVMLVAAEKEMEENGIFLWSVQMIDNDTRGWIIPGLRLVNNAGFFITDKKYVPETV